MDTNSFVFMMVLGIATSLLSKFISKSIWIILGFFISLFLGIFFFSPAPTIPHPSEENYVSAESPDSPLPLPDLEDDNTPATVDLSVVIPAFNEVPRLPSMLQATFAHLATPKCAKRSVEIIVVDDGSSDGTSELALDLAKKYKQEGPRTDVEIRVVTLVKNLGKGGAVRHGMLHARGRRLLFADADGASQFEDLELLWDEMDKIAASEDDFAVVIGSRAHLVKTEAVVKRSVIRNLAMYGLHTVLRLVGVGHIRDTQCGFKLFTRPAARAIFPHQHLKGWIFDVELILLAKQQDIPVKEVPISWHEVPQSKLKLVTDSIRMFTDLLVLRVMMLSGVWGPQSGVKELKVE